MIKLNDKSVILFQGDSITDGGRIRGLDPNHIMGHGYVFNAASYIGYTYAEKQYEIYNRGIEGDGIDALAARWDADTLAYKPDLLSILIGLKDAMNAGVSVDKAKEDAKKFGEKLNALVETTLEKLPGCKIALLEPFALALQRVWQYHPVEGESDDGFKPHYSINPIACAKTYELKETIGYFQEEVKKAADKNKLIFVPLQDVFDKAVDRVDGCYWLWDGAHPTSAGHFLISERWLEVIQKNIEF